MGKIPCVYILASRRNGTLYIGVTSNLQRRLDEHKGNKNIGFTQKYHVHLLVYYEVLESMMSAIEREKQIKAGSRRKKLEMIERVNPDWKDLSNEI